MLDLLDELLQNGIELWDLLVTDNCFNEEHPVPEHTTSKSLQRCSCNTVGFWDSRELLYMSKENSDDLRQN